jgi:sigma-B regulation protein RsbU (phosphoserine phosphatase)
VQSLEEVGGPPLGLFDVLEYEQTTLRLRSGDILAFYTDGITEVMNAENRQFGVERLDDALKACGVDARGIIAGVVASIGRFTNDQPPIDDQTLLVAKVG